MSYISSSILRIVSFYEGGIVTGRRTIIETVPGYSFCGMYTVLVRRRPPEEIGVTAPGYSIFGGGDATRTVSTIKRRKFITMRERE